MSRNYVRVVGALLSLALVGAACSNADDDSADNKTSDSGGKASANGSPGVTKDEIRFSAFGTRSNNPTGACVLDCYVDGIKAYFDYRNAEGGIYGRKLTLPTVLDDALSDNQKKALEIVSADDTFASFSATQLATGWKDIAKAGIPLYTWGIHATELNDQDGIFANFGVLCAKCTSRFQVYGGTLLGAKKIATLGYGVTQPSKDCVASQAASVEKYGKDTGQKIVYKRDDLAFGLPNGIAPEVSAMKRAGVDFITTCLDLNGMKTLAQELKRQGMGDVPMMHPNTYDQKFVKAAGDLFEGDLVQVQFRPFETDTGEGSLADFLKWMDKSGAELSELAMVGWINADLAYQGIKAAGEGFDRASVIAATNKMTDYSADGLMNPVDWTRQHQAPTDDDPATHGYAKECLALVKVHDGEFQVVGEKDKPFNCWDNSKPADSWSEPEPTSFD